MKLRGILLMPIALLCAWNVLGGVSSLVLAALAAMHVGPFEHSTASRLDEFGAIYPSVPFMLFIAIFGIVLGCAGLHATYMLAQRWNLIARAPRADASIRQRAFEHWATTGGGRA